MAIASPELTVADHLKVDSIGFAFVKSGYEAIQDELLTDFTSCGLHPLQIAPIVLSERAVDYFYRDSSTEHFFPDMKRHLTTYPVTVMALAHPSQNAQEVLHGLKTGSGGSMIYAQSIEGHASG